jgi:hypothetical protein
MHSTTVLAKAHAGVLAKAHAGKAAKKRLRLMGWKAAKKGEGRVLGCGQPLTPVQGL